MRGVNGCIEMGWVTQLALYHSSTIQKVFNYSPTTQQPQQLHETVLYHPTEFSKSAKTKVLPIRK